MMGSSLPDNLDSLLAPIAGADPAGDPNAYRRELRDRFGELRREERAEDFDDANRPQQLKRADWEATVAEAVEALTERTKDLRVACHLLEGLTRTDGFAGLAAGLDLLARLVEQCWDRLNPPLDPEDPEVRSDPLANMLDDPSRGVMFPETVRSISLLGRAAHQHAFRDWQSLRAAKTAQSEDESAKTLAEIDPDELRLRQQEIERCLKSLDRLVEAANDRMADYAPGMTRLRAALDDCLRTVRGELAQMTEAEAGPESDPENAGAEEGAPESGGTADPRGAAAARSEAYRQLRRAADLLQQLEPHSPIPYLVKRAVGLGQLPFPQLMEQLIRDDGVLRELNREMGVPAQIES